MRVSSDISSIQLLKAQQAWEARRAAPARSAAPKIEPVASEPIQNTPVQSARLSVQELEPSSVISVNPPKQWGQTVQEIQSIAAKAGYIDVSERDIQRAYALGESLLADYRI